jgi:hypothetical protein
MIHSKRVCFLSVKWPFRTSIRSMQSLTRLLKSLVRFDTLRS